MNYSCYYTENLLFCEKLLYYKYYKITILYWIEKLILNQYLGPLSPYDKKLNLLFNTAYICRNDIKITIHCLFPVQISPINDWRDRESSDTAEITMTPTSKTFFLLIVDVKNTLVSDDHVLRDCYSITE